ncbi:MAG: T9SS type A sorting domain-containing protein [Flavobacteriales bacterium]|nr:T9SS type A sorting domain-containing protein [Flavobacteriales bacterium]MCB9198350.1 T9SS type A sorting domain-containing protein [Flavobacteriales bacterium]
MKNYTKNAFILGVATFLAFSTNAQQVNNFRCGSLTPDSRFVDYNDYLQNRAEEIDLIKQGVQQKSGNDSLLVIPVVFHILHEYGSENISDAQILDQINILNVDYKKLNPDTASVIPAFSSIIGNPQLEFRLARLDPNGNCTNGIDRIYTQETSIGDDGSKMHNWPRSRYLNVWVVKDMENGVAGYAYYPSATISGFGAYIDGVIIRHDYIGSIGTSSVGHSRALTHEIGHYLSLPHVWGDNNDPGQACGDDGFADTPESKGWNHCPTGSSDICNPGIEENYQNYMEYSYCSHMFTEEQTVAMRSVLHLPTALRNNLWTENNLQATGVADSFIAVECEPIADFYPEDEFLCFGETITLYDNSFNATPTSWYWEIEGGNPATSTDQNPSVTFSQSGWHTISLTVSSNGGTDEKTVERSVFVTNDYTDISGVYSDDLEEYFTSNIADFYPTSDNAEENTDLAFVVLNGGVVNVASWELTDQIGFSGNQSLMLDAYRSNGGMKDYFITPSYDLTMVNGGSFNFKYSTASSTSDVDEMTETLKVYSSTNCGNTWVPKLTIEGVDLMTAGQAGSAFYPTSSQWALASIPITGTLSQSNVRFKIEFTSGDYSNNVFIDDIAIDGTMKVEDNINVGVSIYPNPVSDIAAVNLNISTVESKYLSVEILDITGKKLHTSSITTNAGENTISLGNCAGLPKLSKGIYLIVVKSDEYQLLHQKILIK